MSSEQFMNEAVSPWLKEDGPDSDIIMSSRIRLARNFEQSPFPLFAEEAILDSILYFMEKEYNHQSFLHYKELEFVRMSELKPMEKQVLVEKHLISPHLADKSNKGAALISKNEQVSIMVNEEDHIRTQLYFPGFQLDKALEEAFLLDDWLEEKIDYAFDETRGYLTSCPTNVGTGLRASVMMHLPALVITRKMNRMIPAINQLGLVVRGIYGEGSEALGNIFQISNQITLGRSEPDIIEDLKGVVEKLIEHERHARNLLMEQSGIELEDRVFRSYGLLKYSRIVESKETAKCLSDVRLGIDLGFIKDISKSILNELVVLTQPAFLQQYAKKMLTPNERDVFRASLIRERFTLEQREEF
ncbi:ATP:guanido phosphotransferase YacI [Gracilibacillus boraciitolerans JCM 21714]|uniref:Protein-arginine kinase n=1 Tax=Gracilibacillus boraciitolerans JCM 21714 TaxID=1298598 RepID=W4VLZ5_9BACI|nr:protein arginine kinase [Gracilibacillus boraciitolerans]GAE93789.1 ATP:guanido phosphotransferase YacI [Gracilibacillus boraciitolerans JCM 21714]